MMKYNPDNRITAEQIRNFEMVSRVSHCRKYCKFWSIGAILMIIGIVMILVFVLKSKASDPPDISYFNDKLKNSKIHSLS